MHGVDNSRWQRELLKRAWQDPKRLSTRQSCPSFLGGGGSAERPPHIRCYDPIADGSAEAFRLVTRLIDRLEKRNLLLRSRGKEDRRFVTIQLTSGGLELVNQLDEPIEKWNRKLMRNIRR